MSDRNQAAVSAIMDEYERSVKDLQRIIATMSDQDLAEIADRHTDNPDCRSIQTVLAHVVSSGYSYGIYIQAHKNKAQRKRALVLRNTASEYVADLKNLMTFTRELFADIYDDELEEPDNDKKIKTNWQQSYDIEQLMEHAIVHVLRHRRQIEGFVKKQKSKSAIDG